ncbi:hypothetical protein DK871_15985 [Pseudomonas sp. L13]|nr:hypothetical protein [Pseudomonas sp. L13]
MCAPSWGKVVSRHANLFTVGVGASLLAKHAQAPRTSRSNALSLTFFASKLAPTDDRSGI